MKLYYILIPLLIFSCKSKTGTVTTSDSSVMEKSASQTNCPEDGTCTTLLHLNSTLEIVDDGSGRLYTQMAAGENLVVEFTYYRPGPEGTADGNYTETIQFEVPSDVQDLILENEGLSAVKMVFGKMGYRNVAFYPIPKGKLVYNKTGKKIVFSLDFKLDQDSHEISRIRETVIME